MNHRFKHSWLLAEAALAALLAACGGGGSADSAPAPVSAAMVLSFNDIAGYCGIDTRLPVTSTGSDGAVTTLSVGGATAHRDPNPWLSTYVVWSATGHQPNPLTFTDATMKLDTEDYRTMTLAPGYVRVSAGIADLSIGKGAQVTVDLPAGGIVCAGPAAWYKSNGIGIDPVTLRTVYDTGATVHWESRDGVPLPLSTLPGYAIDAFELVSNFDAKVTQVYFAERKGTVADPTAVRICHVSAPSTAWDCHAPTVTDTGTSWRFTLQASTRGTYALVSSHAQAGQ